MTHLPPLRQKIQAAYLGDESELVASLVASIGLTKPERGRISQHAETLIHSVRSHSSPGMMEAFLAEYGLSTKEGVALMCLAEALLRVPDDETIDQLIHDKVVPHDWASHVGDSGSILVNASTWALMLTGRMLDDEPGGVVGALQGMLRRLGEPVVRLAVERAMREMGEQFVLGQDINEATKNANANVAQGYTYSYDMLGEAARTEQDALRYHHAYAEAIALIADRAHSEDLKNNPGISVKLSALHPRYSYQQRQSMLPIMCDRLLTLAQAAAKANIGLNIDAEEADRLDISLDIIEKVLAAPSLSAWQGFGVVVQAYGQRAAHVLDWLYALSTNLDRRIMVRLVKGAYWDTEIKRSQVMGLPGYPVFTRKRSTDISYIACAKKLMAMRDRIYPQFATHNAHTISAVLALCGDNKHDFEFQRLHGMGEVLHDIVKQSNQTRCRIYAPVGTHEDLLAYLVRRLLENGANSSFVNQIVDAAISPSEIAADPIQDIESIKNTAVKAASASIRQPRDLYGPGRKNSRGWDINDPVMSDQLLVQCRLFNSPKIWAEEGIAIGGCQAILNPANPQEKVGVVANLHLDQVDGYIDAGISAQGQWEEGGASKRADILFQAADEFEANTGELIALLIREAGKTYLDAISELREAVDFLRYYARESVAMEKSGQSVSTRARGVIVCISPWNFPLAIFTGQIAAALVTGNAVIAKPAEQTPLVARKAVALMHLAGVPDRVLQYAPGPGETIGAALVANRKIGGVCFTGSTEVAKRIDRQLAASSSAETMLIAETGGLNAMIVDSTALLEQAVTDIVEGAFQSAGQRCSALRVLYVQEDIYERLLTMLCGATDTLVIGDP